MLLLAKTNTFVAIFLSGAINQTNTSLIRDGDGDGLATFVIAVTPPQLYSDWLFETISGF
jgi:hypothetical protein